MNTDPPATGTLFEPGWLTTSRRAELYLLLAEDADADEGTTYTDEALYRATTKLIESHMAKLLAADVIRGDRPAG